MSRLEELIAELCLDGVEYKTLGELGEFYGGLTGKSKADFKDGNARFITYKNVYSNPALNVCPVETVRIAKDEKQRTLQYGDIIFTGSSETPDECGFSSVVTKNIEEPLYLNSFCFFLRLDNVNILLPDFAKHLFRSSGLRFQIGKTASGVTRFNVSKEKMAKIRIPIPPLPVQSEIVKILDNFTELTARRKQYSEYLNILIDKDRFSNPTIIKLGELFDFKNGLSKGKEFFGRGTPFVRYTDVYNKRVLHKEDISALVECTSFELEKLKVTRGDVLFTRTSETAEDVGWSSVMLDDIGACVFNGFTIRAKPKTDRLLPEYCAYCFSTNEFRQYVTSHCAFTTRASLTGNTIAEYSLVVPSITEQQEVVNILDKLYLLCNSLTSGLPAEIAARQKQYEYYRDRLLTFKEKKYDY